MAVFRAMQAAMLMRFISDLPDCYMFWVHRHPILEMDDQGPGGIGIDMSTIRENWRAALPRSSLAAELALRELWLTA
jgi:hypothetical protein